ncbi:unnamed protein product [Rotaria magnacalcarata]|uniref:Coiled-coil domain-containing protein 149 n=2 Tax=Rotaria magnacalcarata TaxID=392030 RepID=A0A816N649_9BILA|nr:unnamed protein product [Rotaria magnacalcarata]CAF3994539.1 unnamed protein product [Rotaria magnacalcarata]
MSDMSVKQQQIESLNSEIQILQKKLDSKTKAFAILINELDALKHERDQFKSLADSLQEKCVQLKKQVTNKIDPLATIHHSSAAYEHPNDMEYSSVKSKESTIHLLKTALKNVQDEKETLQAKIDELVRELNDVKGDLSIFRQKRHRARIGSNTKESNTKETNNHNDEQALLLQRLEQSNERINELDNDLKLIVCQKEELEIERDSFKTKYNKLNQELNKILNGNQKHIVDIELVLSENRYLKEKINELIQEKSLLVENAAKYKDLLQTHRSAYNRLGKVQSSGSILTHKQVRSLIDQSYIVPNTPDTQQDLRSIAEALYENIKDKNITIIHQRKTNKILANRVTELENLLANSNLAGKSDQTSELVNLLDRTPTPTQPEGATSQFVNSIDEFQQPSPTQIISFSPTWSTSPPSSLKTFEDDFSNKTKTVKHTPTAIKNKLECHQSTTIRTKSESIDLEMDDPLQLTTLTSSIAYLEERDLIPPTSSDADHHSSTQDEINHLHELLNAAIDKNNARQATKLTDSNSTVTNLTC